ncbi:hypothetical protein N7475_009946 [Penicillium sp. IBT 31633x]|nr:hypothetical protein N7475_009946 [Penicillium sp. IBT 31633x]
MGYIRNVSPNRNGHGKSSIKVGQFTGGADANGGGGRGNNGHVGRAVHQASTHGMPECQGRLAEG